MADYEDDMADYDLDEPELPFEETVFAPPSRGVHMEHIRMVGRGARAMICAPSVVGLQPKESGFYWARWHTPAPDTEDNGEGCNPDEWQVCQVFENGLDRHHPEYLMVFVPGVAAAQPLNAFEWGRRITR